MKKITIQDVARKAGVSPATASRVVNQNGYVSEEKKLLVLDAINVLGYKTAAPVLSQEAGQTNICVISGYSSVSELILSAFSMLTTSIMNVASQHGFRSVTMMSTSTVDSESIVRLLPSIRETAPAGLIITGFADHAPSDELDHALQNLTIPVVFVERAEGCNAYNRVLIDNRQGIYDATRYLIQKGHRSILYVMPDEPYTHTIVETERLQGVLDAVNAQPKDSIRCYICKENMAVNGIRQAGFHAMQQMLEQHPDITAVLNWADGFAAGELEYLRTAGKRCPDDIEIIGHDDTLAPYMSPAISSIHIPYPQIAEAVVEIVENSLSESGNYFARTTTIVPRFILRS